MTDHLRTGSNAGFDCLRHQLRVEAGLLGDLEALRDTGNLDRTHQIVDQFVNRAATDGAEMPDRGRERREIWPRSFEIRGLGADPQGQFSAGGGIRQTRDRTIDIEETASAKLAREIERMSV